ncbi:TOMM precursor leader peptide-binding protein [Streptomyces nigra]|uniref:TOMM precursor leader peptide-binding protein n=1 Tax=Streptomyces nigra TaxID=1827580 RepID=UPI0036C40B6B
MTSADQVSTRELEPGNEGSDPQSDAERRNTPELYSIRPGACFLPISADQLQITFPNYTATFNGVPVVAAIEALLAAIGEKNSRSTAVRSAATASEYPESFIDYVFDMALKAQCLAVGSEERRYEYGENEELANYYSSLGEDPKSRLDELRESRTIVIQLAGTGHDLIPLLREAGMTGSVLQANPGDSVSAIIEKVAYELDDSVRTIACWGMPYRFALPRKLNELAISRRTPILFGACEGIVARIGPYVMPGATACLECALGRLLSHAGTQEIRAYAELRARSEERVPEPWPSHPTFREAMARLFVLELGRIAARERVTTMGAFVEHTVLGGTADRHPVLRVPRCPTCTSGKPRRLAWDVRFPAPETAGDE